MIDKLEEKIANNQGIILPNLEISKIKKGQKKFTLESRSGKYYQNFDKVIYTGPVQILPLIANFLPKSFAKKTDSYESVGNLGLVLELKKSFFTDKTYWLNINDVSFPFVCVVEQTNFISPKHYGDSRLLYVYGYYPHDHPIFKESKEEVCQRFLPYLKKISSDFTPSSIIHCSLFKNLYSQPIIPINYSRNLPPLTTPIKGLYFATLHHLYPWDRGTNYAVKLGKEVAYEILKED